MRKDNNKLIYIVSREGETEELYFKWLQNQINNHPKTVRKVEFRLTKAMPSSYMKGMDTQYAKSIAKKEGHIYYRVQDIESNSGYHVNNFNDVLKTCKESRENMPFLEFNVAYTYYSFEVWMILHKSNCTSVFSRSKYISIINSIYGEKFIGNDDYKKKDNFSKLLEKISINDIINNAIPKASKIKKHNVQFNQKYAKNIHGVAYYLADPDLSLHEFIERILLECGIT